MKGRLRRLIRRLLLPSLAVEVLQPDGRVDSTRLAWGDSCTLRDQLGPLLEVQTRGRRGLVQLDLRGRSSCVERPSLVS